MTGITMSPITEAQRNGQYYLVAATSDYLGTPYQFHAARWDREGRCWLDHKYDSVRGEHGEDPTHWAPLPTIDPEKDEAAQLELAQRMLAENNGILNDKIIEQIEALLVCRRANGK